MSTLAIGGAPHAFVHSAFGQVTAAVTKGPYANRPAAAAASGRFYYATDMQALFMSNGVTWTLVSPSLPTVSQLGADTTIDQEPNYTDLVTVNAQGTGFLVHAIASGENNSVQITPRLRVLIDGVETNYWGVFGTGYAGAAGAGQQVSLHAYVTGLAQASHAFKLQASWNGAAGGWAINAASVPKREGAILSVTTIASG